MNTNVSTIVNSLKARGDTAKSANAHIKKADPTLLKSVDELLKTTVAETGFAPSGGLGHGVATLECLIEAGAIDGDDKEAVKMAFRVLMLTENASAWAQRAGLRGDDAETAGEATAAEF